MSRARGLVLFAAVLSAAVSVRAGSDVVAVLTADSGPYHEAYQGFLARYGEPVPTVDLSKGEVPPPDARVLVTFGGKAALVDYDGRATRICALAPGVTLNRTGTGRVIRVFMSVSPEAYCAALKTIQPNLRRLALVWASEGFRSLAEKMPQITSRAGLQYFDGRMEPDRLPDGLRALRGNVDAFVVVADPLLINSANLQTFRDFSWANGIPFYVTLSGIADKGPVAAIASSFAEIGAAAAEAARQVLSGQSPPDEVYAKHSEVTINLQAADKVRLKIDNSVLDSAKEVIR